MQQPAGRGGDRTGGSIAGHARRAPACQDGGVRRRGSPPRNAGSGGSGFRIARAHRARRPIYLCSIAHGAELAGGAACSSERAVMYGGMINDGCVCGHASATMLAGVYADLDLPEGCQAGFGFKKCAWIATWLSGAVPAILRPCTTAPSPHNQVWFGAIIGVVPFVIGTYEFTKRIVSGCGGPRPTEGHGASQQRGSARLSA